MKEVLLSIYYFLIFPGFLFTAVAGLMAGWIDRKVTARIQWRVGPPWYQNFADFFKLLGKETIVPRESKGILFLASPLIGLAGITLVSTIILRINFAPDVSFIGDLIVILYLLVLPSLAVIIGGSASKNPLASVGASREMKLILGYELPFILAIFVAVAKSGSIRIGEILSYQAASTSILASLSGIIAFIVCFLCMQAKLTFVPFDIPEAETEIMAGPYIEYSGVALAVFKLTRAMMLFILPVFLITVFWGGVNFASIGSTIYSVIKYVIILVLIILVKNTNPRLRIDQAMKFFWGKLTVLAAAGLALALLGL